MKSGKTKIGESKPVPVPPLLCGHHSVVPEVQGYKARCRECGSYWDTDSLAATFVYEDTYAEQRGHFAPELGRCKVSTLRRWERVLGLQVQNLTVCEIGFGAGFCLKEFADQGANVFGIEAQVGNVRHAVKLGLSPERLMTPAQCPERLPREVDLWVFQDSFEHILDLEPFMAWLNRNSSEGARALIVCPRADSLSNTILGRLWPHKLPDHSFHWTRAGLLDHWARKGWALAGSFYPAKDVSLEMVFRHLRLKGLGFVPQSVGPLDLIFRFNFGEMGLLLEKTRS